MMIGQLFPCKCDECLQIYKLGKENLRMSGCHIKYSDGTNRPGASGAESTSFNNQTNNCCDKCDDLKHEINNLKQNILLHDKRIKENAYSYEGLKYDLDALEERVENVFVSQVERIGILGRALHDVSEENHNLRNRPHKCPICDGTSFCRDEMMCLACDGTGIVWG